MKVKISCLDCKSKFLCTAHNTRIQNPIITVKCPNCGYVYEGNVSAFAFKQLEHTTSIRIERAAFMINLMQNISFIANDDKHGVKIRKYTRKRWNTRRMT